MVVLNRLAMIRNCLLVLIAMAAVTGARASELADASVQRIEPLVASGQLMLDVDLDIQLNDRMKQALTRGVPLTFLIEAQISAPRWWWFDKTIVDAALPRRLSYNTLTRNWRVTTGDFSVTAPSLDDAMQSLSTVRNWPIVLSDRFEPDQTYMGAIRVRLDSEQLARPLQMEAANDQWSLDSTWKSFDFSIRRLPEERP